MKRFERLSRLSDYTVDKHHADPRGWDVINSTGRSVGEVKDLIVDMSTMKATYLDVELDRSSSTCETIRTSSSRSSVRNGRRTTSV
jgi:sporulation protein YlmC with PRC-barrel domain